MGRPTKAQAEAWTQELLDAARALFCEKGYAGASLDELAVRLRCSKHSIYRRFTGKEALFGRVVERDVARFVAALEAARTSHRHASALDGLRDMARTYFGYGASREYAALYAAMNLEATTSPSLRARAAEWAVTALAPMRAAVAAVRPDADPAPLCDIVIDLLDGAAARSRLGDIADSGLDAIFQARWAVIERVIFSESDAR